jgi:hypothetical protein
MSGNGASFSLPHLPAKVSSLKAERPLSLGGANWPSCHVDLQRLEVAAAVASASDESDVIGGNFAAPKLLTSRRMPILQHRWHFG